MAETTQSNPGVFNASDYEIKSFMMYTSDGQAVDLTNLILELNIYEDLFSATISGEVLLSDALDMMAIFSVHGNEYVKLTIDKPSLDQPIEKTFRIYSIKNRTYTSSQNLNYVINFCSEENVLSSCLKVSKSYKGARISDMVYDIAKNFLMINPDRLVIEPTEGIFDIIIPNMDPLQAIHWLSTRAYAQNKSVFFFFENRDGFNFVSFETLATNPSYSKYYKSAKFGDDNIKNSKIFTYLNSVEDFNIVRGVRYGSYSSTVIRYDIVNRQFQPTFYNGYNFKGTLLNKDLLANKSTNRLGVSLFDSYFNSIKYVITNDSDPYVNPMSFELWLGPTIAKLGQLTNFKMVGTLPGDVLLKVGAAIDIEIPNMVSQSKDYEINEHRSGKYIVSAVNHKFMAPMVGKAYNTTIEFITDSVNKEIPTAQENSSILNELKKS